VLSNVSTFEKNKRLSIRDVNIQFKKLQTKRKTNRVKKKKLEGKKQHSSKNRNFKSKTLIEKNNRWFFVIEDVFTTDLAEISFK
jgi:hypothetical protein